MCWKQISFICATFLVAEILGQGKYMTSEYYVEEESVNGTVDCGTYAINGGSSYLIKSKDGMASCVWTFLGTTDCYPMITCPRFSISPSWHCLQDYLALSDGSADVGLRFCGKYAPHYATSQSSILKATLSVNSDYGTPLFQCKVSCAKHHLNYNGYGFGYNYHQDFPPKLIPTTPPKVADCDCGLKGPLVAEVSVTSLTNGRIQAGTSINIVGGEPAKNGEYRMFAAMVVAGSTFAFCGGTLISDRCILTAAHCVFHPETGELIGPEIVEVLLNPFDLDNIESSTTARVNVSKIIPHPLYDNSTMNNDVAILKLSQPVRLVSSSYSHGGSSSASQPTLRTVCLPPPKTYDDFVGQNATVIGFGATSEGGDSSDTLLKVTIPVISNEKCQEMYSKAQPPIIITSNMLCAAKPSADSCQGDSGGPIMTEVYKRYMQIGIVSFGEGCARADFPGVYSRVTELNDWIRMTCRKSTWCRDLGTYQKYQKTYYE